MLNKRAKKASGKNKEKISKEKGDNYMHGEEGNGEPTEVIHHRRRSKNFAFQLSLLQHKEGEKGENFREGGEGIGGMVEVIHHWKGSKNFAFQPSLVQQEYVNNSYNPELATYEKHWHFFSFVFPSRSQASICLV